MQGHGAIFSKTNNIIQKYSTNNGKKIFVVGAINK
jgi:hypothetical protein